MFNVDDMVLYGNTGACRIKEKCKRQFDNKIREYYLLVPVYDDKTTIYVPTDNNVQVEKMKRVLSVEEIQELINSMQTDDELWINDEKSRQEKYKNIIKSGNRMELIKMIKALRRHQKEQQEKGKKLYIADEKIFKEAQKMLHNEFAVVLNIKPEEVIDFIVKGIEEREKELQG